MNISLVVPEFLSGTSFLQQPLGLLYAATLLENQGHVVKIEDVRVSHVTLESLVNKVKSSDVVFVTSTTYDQAQNYFVDYRYAYTVKTVNYIKTHMPEVPLVVCGAHSTVRPGLVLKDMKADAVIQGEYAYLIADVVEALENGFEFNGVPNMVYRHGCRVVRTWTDWSLWHPDMPDDLLPAYRKIDMSAYFGVTYTDNVPLRRRRRGVILASRGCPYSCDYCHNFWGRHVRKRSAESVVAEMEILKQQYGIEEIFFIDLTFTLDRQWVIEICELLRRKALNLELTVETRADLLDRELLRLMGCAGFRNIWLGVESFDDDILTTNHKGHSADIIVPTIELVRQSGISPHAFIMLGMRGETVDTLNGTIRVVHQLKIPYTRSIMICTPRYGTALYSVAKEQYPEIENGFYRLNAVKGLVGNEMTPSLLLKAKKILKDRDFVFGSACPQL